MAPSLTYVNVSNGHSANPKAFSQFDYSAFLREVEPFNLSNICLGQSGVAILLTSNIIVSAFGKHIFNVTPVVIGIFAMQVMMAVDEPSSTASLLSALFGTTLAPIAGHYGWKAGILVGLLHAGLVPNTGITHAGLNLYNNGFAGGFVAATVVPVLDGIRERKEMRERISKD